MQLYNPTEDVIHEDYTGRTVFVGPEEVKWEDDDCGKHVLRKQSCNGLVALNYGPNEESQFG